MSLRGDKVVCIIAVLFAAPTVCAKPTVTGAPVTFDRHTVTQDLNVSRDTLGQRSEPLTRVDSELAAVGTGMLQPPAPLADFTSSPSVETAKTLPPAPGAVFMVLTGFACVSLVKDRRVWLTLIAGLLWAGQVGVQAMPQFARRITKKHIHQQLLNTELRYLHDLESHDRCRSDIEGSRHIGLLHYLAGIPVTKRSSVIAGPFAVLPAQDKIDTSAPSLALQAEQYACFSAAAFIFDNLARGPPAA